MASKYDPLAAHLRSLRSGSVTMTFAEVSAVVGFRLPASPRDHDPWWANEVRGNHTQARCGWMAAGWEVADVDRSREVVTFRRVRSVAAGR